MSRWFRHYAGLCRDDKLVSVAIKSKQPIERVVWVWAAILESAAEIDDGGRYGLDPAEVAYFLRTDEADISSIENALHDAKRLADGCVVAWGKRQFQSDRSRERVAAYRERKRADNVSINDIEASQNGCVTLQKRYCNAPETETETEIEREEPSVPSVGSQANATEPAKPLKEKKPKAAYNSEFELVWSEWPKNPNESKKTAFDRFCKLSAADREAVLDGAMAQTLWLDEETKLRNEKGRDPPPRIHLSTFISERRFETLLQTRFNRYGKNPWPTTPHH